MTNNKTVDGMSFTVMISKWLLVTMTICACSASGLILSDQCMAPLPCFCSPDKILCDSYHFTSIPEFSPSTIRMDHLFIYLPANDLTVIPANAFHNINTSHAQNISILFQSNKIYQVDMNAFNGIEDNIIEIFFQDNKLTSIPAALGRLTRLHEVQFQANPIATIDGTLMAKLGQTLTTFALPLDKFNSWPFEVNELRHLSYIGLSGYHGTDVPINAFCGLESSLTELHLSGYDIKGIPTAVCFLRHLRKLTVNRIRYDTPQDMLDFNNKCQHVLSQLETINI